MSAVEHGATIDWEWQKNLVKPADILGAARTIPVVGNRVMMALTSGWVPACDYLAWAKAALDRGGNDGWDTAAGLAKRAVCRQMDAILVHNNLSFLKGKNYKEKAGYLNDLNVPGLRSLRDLVIDPRNGIEHAYELATEDQARQAYDIATMFAAATQIAADGPAIVALGGFGVTSEIINTAPGCEMHSIVIGMTRDSPPLVLIFGYPDNPHALVLLPHDEEMQYCPMAAFSSAEALTLNARLRKCLEFDCYCGRYLEQPLLDAMRTQMKLDF